MENWKMVKLLRKIKLFDYIFTIYFKHKEVLNYLIFGVLTTLTNIISYFILAKILHVHYMISTILSLVISIVFAYITNRLFVFESRSKNIVREMFSFFFFRFLSSLIDIFDMYLFVDIFKFNDMLIKIISNFIIIVLNYIFSKIFVFKGKS